MTYFTYSGILLLIEILAAITLIVVGATKLDALAKYLDREYPGVYLPARRLRHSTYLPYRTLVLLHRLDMPDQFAADVLKRSRFYHRTANVLLLLIVLQLVAVVLLWGV